MGAKEENISQTKDEERNIFEANKEEGMRKDKRQWNE